MILSAIRSFAASFAQDPNQTRYSAARYLSAINQAQTQFCLDTRALWKDSSDTSVAGQGDYDLPTNFMYEQYATYAGIKLIPISRNRVLDISSSNDWTTDAAQQPTHIIIDPEEASKTYRIYPLPTNAGDTIVLRYYPFPTTLSADSDTPLNSSALMQQFHVGLAAFAAWLLLLSEQSTPQIVEKRSELLKMYADACSKAIDTFKNTASEPLRIRPRVVW